MSKDPVVVSMQKPPVLVTILAVIALAVSVYLSWHTLSGQTRLAGCGEGSGCEEVITTRWASWFGLPVSAGGFLVYAGILTLSLLTRRNPTRSRWLALLGVSAVASASALWFVGLQAFVVKSFCWYCMTAHACGILIGIILVRSIPYARQEQGKRKRPAELQIPAKSAAVAAFTGLVGVAVLAAGQIYTGTAHSVPEIPPAIANPAPAPPSVQQSTAPAALPDILLASGKLRVPSGVFPAFGSPDAPNTVAHFFDFTCPACREFHPQLMAEHQPVENNTVMLMIPIPLDAECNPAVRETSYLHQNACNFARIGLAIWNTRPDVYYMYDQFMFQGQYPPPLDAARTFAGNLIGKDMLDAALVNPQIQDTLRLAVTMFYSPAFTQKALPALATEKEVVVGFPPPGMLPQLLAGPPR